MQELCVFAIDVIPRFSVVLQFSVCTDDGPAQFVRQLVSTPALMILAAAACASAKVTSSRGQRVQRNPNLNSAESSLLTFFQESLKKLKKIEENIKRKHRVL